ncbi:MAG: protein-L-isoaspartate(D-aspartate) O-methyltransferase [Ignavibacteriaceae bacterium]|nr:protein-L-isoaspartate(D-aspartate) O-methyltransferase [Ignavibacteriaceae bacterium]
MYEFEREELVKNLIRKGIKGKEILNAILKVERHNFIPKSMWKDAYLDTALPIGYEQTISQPYTVAVMTEALEVKKGDKILEIGTGSGYQAAILSRMGAQVFSIERNYQLYLLVRKRFDDLGIHAALKYGDGTIGWSEVSPFDGIIVTAGSPDIPQTLVRQLKNRGKMVIPVGNKYEQDMVIIEKIDDNKISKKVIPHFAFVKLIGREGWKKE